MTGKVIVLLAVFLSSIVTCSFSADKSVTIGTLYDYPPFCFKDDNSSERDMEIILPGKDAKALKGYSWDVVRESFHAMGYTISLIAAPWVRILKYADEGKIDLAFPAVKNNERQKIYYFSKHFTDRQMFIVYVNKNSEIRWNGIESLKGLKIGTVRGWSYGEKFDSAGFIIKEPTNMIIMGFKKLDSGRLDGVVGYEMAYDYLLRKEGLDKRFKKLPAFDYNEEFVIGKKTIKNRKLLEDFDKGVQIIKANGMLSKINKKWLIEPAE